VTVLLREVPASAGRAMTRCECARVAFEEVARVVRERGLNPEAAIRSSGCGSLCTACLPDLEAFLRGA
jgi:bacterioferritin-associated ferredoxin